MYLLTANKRFMWVYLVVLSMFFVVGCRKKNTAAAPAAADNGNHQRTEWETDFEKAKQIAQSQGKDLLIDFSGSDWCGWCIKLDKEVFSRHEFVHEADKEFVLVLVDFPNDTSRQSQAVQDQNKKLAEQFQVEFFPTVLLADSNGKPYAQTGYQEGGPKAYLEHLNDLKKKKATP